MGAPLTPEEFSRRSFIAFLLLAPTGLLLIASILLVAEYRQFRVMVSPTADIPELVLSAADSAAARADYAALQAFTAGSGPDSLKLGGDDLNRLSALSPVIKAQGLRYRFAFTDTFLVVTSSQSVWSMQGRVMWAFKRIVPKGGQFLNARVDGTAKWDRAKRQLSLDPERGFLNTAKVPVTALVKRGDMTPQNFVPEASQPRYIALMNVLDTVLQTRDGVVLVRRRSSR